MKSFTLTLMLAFAAGSVTAYTAYAAQVSISQKGKTFSQTELTVKKGDVIMFVNDDAVTHNVMSASSGNAFNLGAQAPGASLPYTFNSVGETMITCAIHPTMKLKVTVAN